MDPGNTALAKRSVTKVQQWLERLPSLGGDETKLLQLQQRCYEVYLASPGIRLREIAVQTGVPVDLVLEWGRQGGWMQRRDAFRDEVLSAVETDYAEFVLANRTKTAREIMDATAPVLKQIATTMSTLKDGDKENTVMLRRLSEALKNVGDLLSKAVGLDAALPQYAPAVVEGKDGGAQAKPVFFNVNTPGPVHITEGLPQKPQQTGAE